MLSHYALHLEQQTLLRTVARTLTQELYLNSTVTRSGTPANSLPSCPAKM